MTATLSGFLRFFHWGPLTAIGIIKCITLTTLYMNSMWWPPNQSLWGFLHQALFLLLSTLATYNYVMATITGPGLLPLKWKPKNPKDTVHLQYCKECEGYKAPRAHHCRKCNRCVKKMDHHCPWINYCVGWANHANFTYFLGFSILGSFHGAIVLTCAFYRGIHRYLYLANGQYHLATVQFTMYTIILCIFALGLAIGVVIALSMLLYFQLKTIWINQTAIEMWIVEKAHYRRMHSADEPDFVYPYDLGWRDNVRQVFNSSCQAKGDGIDWPVRSGCDQYTLTREQLAQKTEKRARTRTFKCIRPATGRFLPVFSQGFRVCVESPWTDEPRINLRPGDIIKVTRFRKLWLFGERVDNEDEGGSPSSRKRNRKGPKRGWFPRRCAIELTEPEFSNSNSDGDDNPAPNEAKTIAKSSNNIDGAADGARSHKRNGRVHAKKDIDSGGGKNGDGGSTITKQNGFSKKKN